MLAVTTFYLSPPCHPDQTLRTRTQSSQNSFSHTLADSQPFHTAAKYSCVISESSDLLDCRRVCHVLGVDVWPVLRGSPVFTVALLPRETCQGDKALRLRIEPEAVQRLADLQH